MTQNAPKPPAYHGEPAAHHSDCPYEQEGCFPGLRCMLCEDDNRRDADDFDSEQHHDQLPAI